jgi:hypothetical protein
MIEGLFLRTFRFRRWLRATPSNLHAGNSLTPRSEVFTMMSVGKPAGNGEGSEMSDAIGTLKSRERTQFAAEGMCRQAGWPVGAASLAGARSSLSVQAHDPGGGPGG